MSNVSDTSASGADTGMIPRLRTFLMTGMNERSLAYFSIGVALVLGAATFSLLSSEDFLNNKSDLVGLLIGVDILAVTVLLFFVGRQVLRLIRERRNRLAGYQLHWKLVTLFGVITVFPAVIVVAFSYFVLDFSLRGWFNERISTAINESVTVADAYLEEHVLSVRGQILAMANDINREASSLSGNRRAFDAFLTNQAGVRNLSEALVMDSTGRVIANSRFAYAVTFSSLGEDFYSSARDGDVAITRTDITNRIRAGVRLNQFVDAYLLVGRFIDPNVSGAVDRTQTAVTEYQSLDIRQLDLKVSFAILFGMVALLLVLGSVWVGINFANAIILPLGAVIQVAEQVRSGNLASRVPYVKTNDEIAQLGLSFNRMLEEVARNREELVEANRQIDKRREFTEAVLAGVSSGVIGIDENKYITLPNLAALEMLGLTRAETIGRKLVEIVPEFENLLVSAGKPGRRNKEQNVEINRNGVQRNLLVRVTTETVARRIVGYVVTFEDVSELLDAQRKAAWSDVARRIAHEIKNPLTPIQLAAERLGAKYTPDEENAKQAFSTYIDTIIRQVDDIGRLVNEFSSFARMPAPQMASHDLVKMVRGQINLFEAAEKDIRFTVETNGKSRLLFTCDDGMIRQVITNLVQNAVDALRDAEVKKGQIHVEISRGADNIALVIRDNGPGLPLDDHTDLTAPYVTMREKGTGLGLAIVRKIVEDHYGSLSLANGRKGRFSGAEITIVFPSR
ncbi:ATP-binding protein [Alphaproteobacteria bacterium LSUCC0684]